VAPHARAWPLATPLLADLFRAHGNALYSVQRPTPFLGRRLLHPGDGLRNDFRRDRLPRSGTAHCRVSDEQHSRLLKRGIDYMRAVEPLEAVDHAKALHYNPYIYVSAQ
jgi:hypothetical protein